jgi:hypothetical protein
VIIRKAVREVIVHRKKVRFLTLRLRGEQKAKGVSGYTQAAVVAYDREEAALKDELALAESRTYSTTLLKIFTASCALRTLQRRHRRYSIRRRVDLKRLEDFLSRVQRTYLEERKENHVLKQWKRERRIEFAKEMLEQAQQAAREQRERIKAELAVCYD